MKKLIAGCLLLSAFSAHSQTLFYYGKDSVSVSEFMNAYKRNNGDTGSTTISEYLDLYIASRLKVAEAKELGLDTTEQLKADLQTLRQQISPAYIIDRRAIDNLITEAFNRSQKDIRVSHIYIASLPGRNVEAKLEELLADLGKGMAFADAARKYSDDPAAKDNGGNLGYITAFTLPYPLENLAYSTPVGTVSKPFRTGKGIHIFKNEGERPALGKMKASQILFAFPPESTPAEKEIIRKRADSVYQLLLKGADFGKLATDFSNDVVSSASKGKMVEFGTGEYHPDFESQAFAIKKDGAFTKPFLTPFGYHIVRRDSRPAVKTTMTDEKRAELSEFIEQSDRMMLLRAEIAKRISTDSRMKDLVSDKNSFFLYSDSLLNGYPVSRDGVYTGGMPVLQFDESTFALADWISYSQTFRYKSDGSGFKSYPQLWQEYQQFAAFEHYKNNLEKYNPEFARQLTEFKDGNLFFEIMQKKIWGPAQTDTIELKQYFEKNREKYRWKESADAVIFFADNEATANTFIEKLKKAPLNWRALAESMNEKIAADSNRFELSQIPSLKSKPAARTITKPLVGKGDASTVFALILKAYPEGEYRTFNEARGMVVTDYQNELEKAWIADLKQKHPVRINQAAWSSIQK